MEIEYEDGNRIAVVVKEVSQNPDLAVLMVAGSMVLPSILFNLVSGVSPYFGDEIFVLACKALADDFSFSFSEGQVTGRAFNGTEITITAVFRVLRWLMDAWKSSVW